MNEAARIDGLRGAFRARERGRGGARLAPLAARTAPCDTSTRQNERSSARADSHHGAPSSQRWRSLAGSNFDSVGMLLPTADSASVSVIPGMDLGPMR